MYRFAHSLTQEINISNLRIALFNYISAKQSNEKFLIRIEDIDKVDNTGEKDQELLEILHLFGIQYDQVIYQSENLKFYQQLATKLLMDKNAFVCFCNPKSLEEKKYDGRCKNLSDEEVLNSESPFVIRIKKPKEAKQNFTHEVDDDFIILNIDKTPKHDFACAIDDMMYDISEIIQEENQIPNPPRQTLIRNYLGYDKEIKYINIPMLSSDESQESLNIKSLLQNGFLPSAIINYLILISHKTPVEIFSIDDALEWFNLVEIYKNPVKFDLQKLRNINKKHIKKLDSLQLSKALGYSSIEIGDLAKIYTQECSTLEEIKLKIDKIFKTKICEKYTKEFDTLKEIAKDAPYFKSFEEYKTYMIQKSGLNGEEFFKPLQILLTGTSTDIDLNEIYPHIKNYLGEIIK